MGDDRVRMLGVHVRYRSGLVVLAGIDLELDPGRPVVVLGANGSGKSTLLRVAAGCTQPTSGSVVGRPRSVGYVPDRFPAHLRMPTGSYLRHMAALHRTGAAAAARRSTVLLRELGFHAGLSTPMAQLSKGNAQKIALAQALCSGARLMVLDEPWSGLDAAAVPVVTAHLAAAAADGAAVLVADHTHTAHRLPHRRVLRLESGRLVPQDLQNAVPPQGPETVRITLLDQHPAQLAGRLPHARVIDASQDRAVVDVTPERSDAVLHTALAWGVSIHSVHRLPAAQPDADKPGADRTDRHR